MKRRGLNHKERPEDSSGPTRHKSLIMLHAHFEGMGGEAIGGERKLEDAPGLGTLLKNRLVSKRTVVVSKFRGLCEGKETW